MDLLAPKNPWRGSHRALVNIMKDFYSPRYANYARVNGRTCDEQLDHDSKEFTGGCMVGYIGWLRHHLLASNAERLPSGELTPEGHQQLDRYLDNLEVKVTQ